MQLLRTLLFLCADFYQPFKEDELEQSTIVPIIFPAEPKPVLFLSFVKHFNLTLKRIVDPRNSVHMHTKFQSKFYLIGNSISVSK